MLILKNKPLFAKWGFSISIRNEELMSADMSAIYKTCIEIKLILGDLKNE